jgi:hypothetical protein
MNYPNYFRMLDDGPTGVHEIEQWIPEIDSEATI